jgi:hypothetical protein
MLFMCGGCTRDVKSRFLCSVHRVRRPLLLVGPALALSVAVAACGGGTTTSGASPTTARSNKTAAGATKTTAPASPASMTKYIQCLTSHGVPANAASGFGARRGTGSTSGTAVPGSQTSGTRPAGTRPTIPAQYQAAFQACRSLRPTGTGFGGGTFNSAQFAAYRNCLQLHGVTLPTTPTTKPGQTRPSGGSGGGFGAGGAFGAQANTPAAQQARQACASLLPARTGPTSTVAPQS